MQLHPGHSGGDGGSEEGPDLSALGPLSPRSLCTGLPHGAPSVRHWLPSVAVVSMRLSAWVRVRGGEAGRRSSGCGGHEACALRIEVSGLCPPPFPATAGLSSTLSQPVLRTWQVCGSPSALWLPTKGRGRVLGLLLSRRMTVATLASLAPVGRAGL